MKRNLRVLLLLCLVTLPTLLQAAITVSFTASGNRAGCNALFASFTPTVTGCSGTPSYTWYYTNTTTGLTDTSLFNSRLFSTIGTYDVAVRAVCGLDTAYFSEPAYINVTGNPGISFTSTTPALDTILSCPGKTISFVNTSTDTANCDHTWTWIVSGPDGVYTASTSTITRTFTQSGNYSVNLIYIAASCGCVGSYAYTNYVKIDVPPTACFTTTGPTTACSAPLTVTYNNCSSNDVSTVWSFNGNRIADPSDVVTHTYTAPGTFNDSIFVYSAAGCGDTAVRNNNAIIGNFDAYMAHILPNDTICQGETVTFSDSSTVGVGTGIISSGFTIIDAGGVSIEAPDTLYPYAPPTSGLYTIIDHPTNSLGCTDSFTRTLYVRPRPSIASITPSETYSCAPPLAVNFSSLITYAAGAGPVSYVWKYTSATEVGTAPVTTFGNPTGSFNYTSTGSYYPRLIVTDAFGCVDSLTSPTQIRIGNPTVITDLESSSACTGSIIGYTVSTRTDGITISDIVVDSTVITDGTTTIGTIIGNIIDSSVSFGSADTFFVNTYWHMAPGLGGCSGVARDSVIIGSPAFTPSVFVTGSVAGGAFLPIAGDSLVCPNTTVRFYTDCPDCIVSWTLRTPDVATATDDTTSALFTVYTSTGYDQTIVIDQAGCIDTVIKKIYVDGPDISLGYHSIEVPNCSVVDSFVFNAIGYAEVGTYRWFFSATDSVTGNPVSHKYTAPYASTTPDVVLSVIGSGPLHCRINDTFQVQIGSGALSWTASDSVCRGYGVATFSGPLDLLGNPLSSYRFTYGDGTPPFTTTSATVTHTYTAVGTYTASLLINNAYGCPTLLPNESVFVSGPTSIVSASPTVVCPGSPIFFNNSSTNNLTITGRWYNFNSTGVTGGPANADVRVYLAGGDTTVTYNAPGTYTIIMSDTDRRGCGGSVSVNVNVAKPIAAFTSSDIGLQICPNIPINFTSTTTGVSYMWNFGDGSGWISSPTATTSHIYSVGGTFTVKLAVTSDGSNPAIPAGCHDTMTRTSYIVVAPIAISSTVLGETSTNCPPINMLAYAISTDIYSSTYTYSWNIYYPTAPSLLESVPGFLLNRSYPYSGTYHAYAVVSNARGCRDSVLHVFTVGGPRGYISLNADSGCVPVNITATYIDTSTGGVAPASSYIWNVCPDGAITTPGPSVSINYTAVGTYCPPSVVIQSGSCIVQIPSFDSIRVYPNPVVSVPTPPVICFGSSTPLTASGADSYTWTPANGLSCTNCPNPIASPTVTTTYTVTGKTIHGCTASTTVTVGVDPQLNLRIVGRDSICIGETDTLIAVGMPGASFTWNGPGLSSPVGDTVYVNTTTTRTYTLVGINSRGCSDTATFTVTVNPLPIITVSPDPAYVCAGGTTQLIANGAATYNWRPNLGLSCDNCPAPVTAITSNIIYTVTGTSQFGCKDSIPVPVRFYDRNVTFTRGDTTICYGDKAQIKAYGGIQYQWTPAGSLDNPTIFNPIASPTVTTIYTVYVKENPCFDTTLNVTVTVIPIPALQLPASLEIIAGTSVQLYANPTNGVTLTSWAWTPADTTLTCTTCPRPIATPNVTTTYSVNASTIEGCTGSGAITIKVLCDQATQVFIPNTFTPNGDGLNDRFYLSGRGLTVIKHMAIYNRWGELVYEGNNIQPNNPGQGWDGTFRGEIVAPDVFMYVVEVECTAGELFKLKGDISIVR